MNLQLNNKTALVTGSTAGIGLAIAQQLLQEGATVYINGRTQQRVDEAIAQLRKEVPNANVKGVVADFAKPADIDALLKAVPTVDILINNVGIFKPQHFTEITDADWIRFYEINVLSGVRLSRHYLPKMLAANWGRIIFISSESAVNIPEEMIHYGMTKTAQLAISRGLAELTKGTSVTVNTVMPGPTHTEGVDEMLRQISEQQKIPLSEAEPFFFKNGRPTSLLQRFASVTEIATLVTYIASPLASATNGSALKADGGVAKFII